MIQRREHACFALEPRQPVRIVNDRVGQDLYCDLALEARVARAVDLAHASCAERADDFVGTDVGAGYECHDAGEPRRSGRGPRRT